MATQARTERFQLRRLDTTLPIRTVGFLAVLGIVQLYCYVNFKGEGFSREVAQLYILIPVLLLVYTGLSRSVVQDLKIFDMSMKLLLGFFAAWAFVLFFFGFGLNMQFGTVTERMLGGTLITQMLFVAPSEELAFRFILPSYLESKFRKDLRWVALLIPQLTFAAFHTGVYQGDLTALFVAFVFGCVMMFLYNLKVFGKEKLGLGFTIGAHAAYNLVLLGVLAPSGISLISGGA
jgi:hypothetical protein